MVGFGISPLTAAVACSILTAARVVMSRLGFRSASTALARICALLMVVFALIQPFLVQIYFVPSRSMAPTLLPGDFVVGLKRPRGLARGDVVVFRPRRADASDFVKRVVGLPGDVVEVINGRVVLNGRILEEPNVLEPWSGDIKWIRYDGSMRPLWRGQLIPVDLSSGMPNWNTDVAPQFAIGRREDGSFVPLDQLSEADQRLMSELRSAPAGQLPEGTYLVLGDNRHHSRDSRHWSAVKGDEIAARVGGVAFPLARMGGLKRNSLPP